MLVETAEASAAEVRCGHGSTGWSEVEPVERSGIVLVRSGLFRREIDGAESVVDTCAGYLQRPGSEQRIAHPLGADVCTVVTLSPEAGEALARSAGADGLLPVSPELDLHHRALIARTRASPSAPAGTAGPAETAGPADVAEMAERLVVLIGSILHGSVSRVVGSRKVPDTVREMLSDRPDTSLGDLAAGAGLSTYHVSRVFRRTTGLTISAYRARLRARRALDLLMAGERDLAALAIATGYADQSHLTRELRRETGTTPARLRALLGPAQTPTVERLHSA